MYKLTIYKTGYIFKTEKTSYSVGDTPNCHNPNVTDFKIVETLEGNAAYEKYWLMNFDSKDENIQKIIKAVFPNILTRIKNEQIKLSDKLYNVAINKLAKEEEKFMVTCSRCCGTGNYSYNQRDGTRCFKCNGLKYVLPKITNKWLKQVEEHFTKTLEG